MLCRWFSGLSWMLIAGAMVTATSAVANTTGRPGEGRQLDSSQTPGPESLAHYKRMAQLSMQRENYDQAADWANRYLKDGGSDAEMRALLASSYYLGKSFENAARALQMEVQASERSGQAPSEVRLQWLLDCYERLGDSNGALWVLERLVIHHPKKSYWAGLLTLWQKRLGPDHRLTLDFIRLRQATGSMTSADDYVQMANLALRAGSAVEAKKAVEEGFAARLLGVGVAAESHRLLREKVLRQYAEEQVLLFQPEWEVNAIATKNGMMLVNSGLALVMQGAHAKGLALMEQGIRIGVPHAPQDAKLRLAIGYLSAGQRARAIDLLRTVTGRGGAADLARLWEWYARQS